MDSYPLTGPGGQATVSHSLALLRPNLPVSLSLYRRLQFGRFSDAAVVITNVPSTAAPATSEQDQRPQRPEPWLVAFVDRRCRPETEVWFHGSWEVGSLQGEDREWSAAVDGLVGQAIRGIKALGPPGRSIHDSSGRTMTVDGGEVWANGDGCDSSRPDFRGHYLNPSIVLWGGVHERTLAALQRLGVVSLNYMSTLAPHSTFLWDIDAMPVRDELPGGLKWGEVKPEHLKLVRSRTQIPRLEGTLAALKSLAVFPDTSVPPDDVAPIAWAFVGLDASLTSLHVEPEYRGRGLAKTVTTKIFKDKTSDFREKGVIQWGYGYVVEGNKGSEGMCMSLGGKSDWRSFWVRVDLSQMS